MVAAAGFFQQKNPAVMETALGEHLVYEAILGSSAFLGDLGTFLNLVMAFCLGAAFPEKAAEFAAGKVLGSVLTEEVSPQWLVLPSCILEDIVEVLEIVTSIQPPGKGPSELFLHLDAQLLLLLVTFILGNGQHVKNPNLRGKAATLLKGLTANSNYRHLVENSPVLANDIVPGCIRVFTAVEKTKQSFYDIRMQLKYQLRIPIMDRQELFERVLPLEAHKKALKSFATENPDEFLKFLNNLCAEPPRLCRVQKCTTHQRLLKMANLLSSGAVALWHCCACGREWRAENLGDDDTECCPFAPKMLAFGAQSAWGQRSIPQMSDEESDAPDTEQRANASSSGKAKLSTESTAAGSRSSCSRQPESPGRTVVRKQRPSMQFGTCEAMI
eukprot:g17432.t1